ncbi:solute carrier organic anion transporter family member 74D-like [Topomyia yanbarensis]|uniref:solute carrier organic anion transporter family member 74D-like n=1 Tax=Topomyia yanbarensis TaxID=2498891 RepID=UPI00273C5470|nr:solute carrier organic anion transporter family member 74D-like [Topomyia yanbarensis]
MTGSEMLTAGIEEETNSPKKITLERSISDYSDRDVQCGFWVCKGKFWQKMASKKLYVLLFGIVGCLFGSTTSYFYGTLTTVEKSIQISSKNAGIIMAGSDLSFVLSSLFLSYYAANRRKPLWIALGITSMGLSCFVNALPHFFYGPNLDDLLQNVSNSTVGESKANDNLCNKNRPPPDCSTDIGNLKPQMLLFLGSFLSGVGTSLYFTLGLTYLDDNVRKEKVPFLSSLSAFGRRLGPMLGFSLASLCLKYFVFPEIDPGYGTTDPRWIGAWWTGWIVLGTSLLLVAPIFAGFPKILPRAAERKSLSRQASRISGAPVEDEQPQVSIGDLIVTLKRLITNKAYVFNNTASIFYFFGYMPYFLFQAKYIEIQYRLTPSQANMVTGSASLVFSALGILIAGAVIQKIKPTSRHLAAWNIFTSVCTAAGIVLYSVLGCNSLNNASIVSNSQGAECSLGCNCDFVKYAPICGSDGNTYLSPCHAGCKDQFKQANGSVFYSSCSCIQNPQNVSYASFQHSPFNMSVSDDGLDVQPLGTAISGSCPVDCMTPFYLFLLVMCLNKFISGTESAANFLIGLRCVEERDKAISMGFSMAINTLFSFLPAPIVFGLIIDRTCVLWGRTCSKQGNCWLYDGLSLRKSMNYTAAAFVIIGTCFDMGTWWYSKNFRIFDEEEKQLPEQDAMEVDPYSRSGTEQKELVVLLKDPKE